MILKGNGDVVIESDDPVVYVACRDENCPDKRDDYHHAHLAK